MFCFFRRNLSHAVFFLLFFAGSLHASKPKNIIFFIADGMGFEHVKAAHMFLGGRKLSFEEFPNQGEVTTCNYWGTLLDRKACDPDTETITDSAAAATAMATGQKVENNVVGLRLPGDGGLLRTMLEKAKAQGKSTGIVTTDMITGATPAGFVAHTAHRYNEAEILKTIFEETMPNVIFGADSPEFKKLAKASTAKYVLIDSLSGLNKSLGCSSNKSSGTSCPNVYAGFGEFELIPGVVMKKTGLPAEISGLEFFQKNDLPHLSDMTRAALRVLKTNEKGFFVMIESSLTDKISHHHTLFNENSSSPSAIKALLHEMMELERAVSYARSFAESRGDTIVVLTADHETGGLELDEKETSCYGSEGCVPSVKWTSPFYEGSLVAQHTNVSVPVYAVGMGAEQFQGTINNTDFSRLLMD